VTRARELGWALRALCLTETVSYGVLYYAFPVLAGSITADTGWSSTAITAVFSAALVVSGLAPRGTTPRRRRLPNPNRHSPIQ
jgi:hypothetical protein